MRMKNVGTAKSTVVSSDETATEPNWLGVDDIFVSLKSEGENETSLIDKNAKDNPRYSSSCLKE